MLSEPLAHTTEELLEQVYGRCLQLSLYRKLQGRAPVEDAAAGCHGVVGVEGRRADEHFIHDHCNRPPVTLASIPLLNQDLIMCVRVCVCAFKNRHAARALSVTFALMLNLLT